MSIWESIKVDEQPEESFGDGEYFTIQFGVEHRKVLCSPGMTLENALNENAGALSYAPGRLVTWRTGNSVLSGSQVGQPGERYLATVSLETKGTF